MSFKHVNFIFISIFIARAQSPFRREYLIQSYITDEDFDSCEDYVENGFFESPIGKSFGRKSTL